MSKGVVVVPSSLYPRTWMLWWFVAPVGETVNQPGISVVGEDHGLGDREQRVELPVRESVGMLGVGLQAHQIDDVDHPDLELREVLAQ